MSGFRRYAREPILVEAQRTVRIDIALPIGQATGKGGGTALNGRDPLALAALVTGMTGVISNPFNHPRPIEFAWKLSS